MKRVKTESTSGVGPISYDSGNRPSLTLTGLRQIRSAADVMLTADEPSVKPVLVSISGNVVTYKIMVYDTLPSHRHDITTVSGDGNGNELQEPISPGRFETSGVGQTNPDAVDAASAGTPNLVEIPDGLDVSSVTFNVAANGW